jgi:hypothetical protein
LLTFCRADTAAAVVTQSNVRFNPRFTSYVGEPAVILYAEAPATTYKSSLNSRLVKLTGKLDLSNHVTNIYWRLRQLAAIINIVSSRDSPRLDEIFFSNKMDTIEREVIELMQSEFFKTSNPGTAFVKAFLDSAFTYIYMFLRDIPKVSPLFRLLTTRVQASLEDIDLRSASESFPDLLLWMLMVGDTSSPGRVWFAHRLKELCVFQNLKKPPVFEGLNSFKLAEELMPAVLTGLV